MPDWLNMDFPIWEPALRLLVAIVCGAIIGWEREKRHRAAGLRTHMLVALGAAGFVLVGMHLGSKDASALSRVIQGIVGGIGFLGAGAIMHQGIDVRGLTTAAGMWVVAAVGAAAGAGLMLLAITISLLGLVVLWIIGDIEHRVEHKP